MIAVVPRGDRVRGGPALPEVGVLGLIPDRWDDP